MFDDGRKKEGEFEKLLGSNDKTSVQDLWREPPCVDFQVNLYSRRIDFADLMKEISEKADLLKDKIDKRKQAQKKIKTDKETALQRAQ